MKIDYLALDQGSSTYYEDGFHKVLESFLQWLINDNGTYQITVDQQIAYKYETDFFGLLNVFNIPTNLHWLILRMNGYTSPLDTKANINSLLIPDITTVDFIRQSYVSNSVIN